MSVESAWDAECAKAGGEVLSDEHERYIEMADGLAQLLAENDRLRAAVERLEAATKPPTMRDVAAIARKIGDLDAANCRLLNALEFEEAKTKRLRAEVDRLESELEDANDRIYLEVNGS